MENKDLQRISKNTLSLVRISDSKDLLKAKPIVMQLREVSEVEVLTEIRVSVEKLAGGLNVAMTDSQVELLTRDILEVYKTDSVEDIQQCLKKGRQGKYSFGHHSRSAITMHLISDWMKLHLYEKSEARENKLRRHKEEFKEPLPKVDYTAYLKRQQKEADEKAERRRIAIEREKERREKYLKQSK